MKTALFILHQQTSEAGDISNKLKIRGFNFEIKRPSLGDSLPTNLNKLKTNLKLKVTILAK